MKRTILIGIFTVFVVFNWTRLAEAAMTAGPDAKLKKIVNVNPIYPQTAKDKKLAGQVTLEATIDEAGHVSTVNVISSAHPLLDQAAMDAVQQWRYEPYIGATGKAEAISTTIVVTFSLPTDTEKTLTNTEKLQSTVEVMPIGAAKRPKLISFNIPEFPEKATKANIYSEIVVEAVIDTHGNVIDVKPISTHPIFTDAVISAVKQWKYEPYVENGVAKAVKFTLTIIFSPDHQVTIDAKKNKK